MRTITEEMIGKLATRFNTSISNVFIEIYLLVLEVANELQRHVKYLKLKISELKTKNRMVDCDVPCHRRLFRPLDLDLNFTALC